MQAHLITPRGVKRAVGRTLGTTVSICRDELRLQDGTPSARYKGGRWELDGSDYSILRIDSPVTVQLELDGQRSALYGPFPTIMLVDGVLLTQHQPDAIAQLDIASLKWIEQSTQLPWDCIQLSVA